MFDASDPRRECGFPTKKAQAILLTDSTAAEQQRSERGQGEAERKRPPVARNGRGVHPALVALAAAAVHLGIGIDQLVPEAVLIDADAEIVARLRREVEDRDDGFVG